MKTFKLKSLRIVEESGEELLHHDIELIDGLIVNREDDQDRWVVEAYTSKNQAPIFQKLQQEREEMMIEVKITKENNAPVVFISSIIGINKMEENMNILFMGKIVDQRKSKIESLLEKLIIEGYQGESLLKEFKKRI